MLDDIASRRTLYAAFDRVRDNAGCRGADGVTVGEFAANLERELDSLQDRLIRRIYHPYPLLRFEIPKNQSCALADVSLQVSPSPGREGGDGRGGQGVRGLRSLCVPAVRDRVLQTAVYLVTRPLFEAEFETCSYAYREGRSVRDAVLHIDQLRRQGFRWLVDADIDSFFDNISHERLLARLARLPLEPYVRELFERWIRAEIYDGQRIYPLQRGIPQGSVVSPMLANLFLDELDENLALFGQTLVRYGDDFVILCKSAEQAADALELTDYLLEEMDLQLNQEKTRTTSFDQGFKFLGAIFLGDAVLLPFGRPKPEWTSPKLPPPLDLLTYLELRHAG